MNSASSNDKYVFIKEKYFPFHISSVTTGIFIRNSLVIHSEGDGVLTLCIGIKCEDGILIASDSRAVYGRGVPISRDTNKIYIIDKEEVIREK